jgi:uncharacterized protein YndB with AHSA1/START domain
VTDDKPDFVYVVFIASTPEAVWHALTAPEFISQYWGGRRIESDWRVGSAVRQTGPGGRLESEGKVLEARPPHVLSYTFQMAQVGDPPSRITFEIGPVGEMVRLQLTHHHELPNSVTQAATIHGWPAILSSLKSLLETGKPLPFTGLGFGPQHTGHEGQM